MLKKLEKGNKTFRGAIGRYLAFNCDAITLRYCSRARHEDSIPTQIIRH